VNKTITEAIMNETVNINPAASSGRLNSARMPGIA